MGYIKEIGKGIVIGVANIVPGVSGGTLAVSMGIYDKIIYSVTHFAKDMKASIQMLLPYGIGAVLGVLGLSFVIEYLFRTFPLQTSMIFVGLIAGGIPGIWEKTRTKKRYWIGYLLMAVTFATLLLLTAFGGIQGKEAELSLSLYPAMGAFAVGIIAAGTMVIPGVSGSMILMMIGYYEPILRTINQMVLSALSLDFLAAWNGALLLLPFGIGVVAGIFLFAKLVEYLLEHFETITYQAILGLVLSSPVVILGGISWGGVELHQVLLGIAMGLFSYVFTTRLCK